MKLLYSRWMREIDTHAIEGVGIPSMVLMENASRGAARWFRECFPADRYTHAVVLAGGGNNGGDGMAVARILADWGVAVTLCLAADPDRLKNDAAAQYRLVSSLGIPVHVCSREIEMAKLLGKVPQTAAFVVDALLGTGIDRPVIDGPIGAAIRAINASGLPVGAVDVPSGLSEKFLPQEGLCVRAHCTATFHAPKVAHLYPDGNDLCGRLRVIDIGIPSQAEAGVPVYLELTAPADVVPLALPRPPGTHKKDWGHVLLVAGSADKPGAGALAAFAALRGGAGLSTLAGPAAMPVSPAARFPEVMSMVWADGADLSGRLEGFSCIAAGPGLGTAPPVPDLVRRLLREAKVPLVLDADALNVLQDDPSVLQKASVPVIITPHPGEFSRLTGWNAERILRDRPEAAREAAKRFGVTVVLKGHHTVVAAVDGSVRVNTTGNPGMATAGSGDVLTGLIAAWMAVRGRNISPAAVAAAAVYIHGRAGDLARRARGEAGLTAGDILEEIPAAIMGIHDDPGPFPVAR